MNPNISGIELIPNQPFIFTPTDPNCLGNDNRDYCVLVNACDPIQIQQKISFCGDNILCDELLGDELVSNGDFAGGDTDWDEAGVNWTIISGIACYTSKDGAGVLYQTIAGLSEGSTYLLTFTISNYDGGTLRPNLWDTPGTVVSADGTYTQTITIAPGHIGETLNFIDIGWSGCIDNISLGEVCMDYPESWSVTQNSVCHSVGSTDAFESISNITSSSSDCLYEISLTLSGMTTGTLTIAIGADTFPVITANGDYVLYVYSSGGNPVTFTPSSDFDGCITTAPILKSACDFPILTMFDLNDNMALEMTQENDGGVVIDKNDNFITWSFKICLLEHTIPYDCYKFKIFDPCNNCFITDNVLTNPEFETDLSGWNVSGGGWMWDAANDGEAKIVTDTGFVEQNAGAIAKRCVQVNVLTLTGQVHFYLTNSALGSEVATLNINSPGYYSICGTGDVIGFSALNASAEVTSVYSVLVEDCDDCGKYCFQLESNCFNYQESHECTKFIEAWCDENSMGFNFDPTIYNNLGFKLRERFRVVNFNPSHTGKKNIQKNSAGAKKLVFGEKDKKYQLRFDYTDQIGHDTIATMMYCDNFQMNHGEINAYPDDYDLVKNYLILSEEYEPEWDRFGRQTLAQSQIEIQESEGGLFNPNLG